MSRLTAIGVLFITAMLVIAAINYIDKNINHEVGNHWIECKSLILPTDGFYYDTNSINLNDYEAMEEASKVCSARKQTRRATHPVTINKPTQNGCKGCSSVTGTDDVLIDNLLVINWEVSPEDHYSILSAHLEK